MSTQDPSPEVTSELLAGFGPHLQGVEFDFRGNKLHFRVERPRLLRVLSFERVHNLHIEPNDLEDIDPDCLDGIIGIQRQEDVFCIHTDFYEISFRSDALSIDERDV
jgi:hypothetical protein